ncbi:hypothetical protein [Fischerella sp. PCC 9605]|uniref:hypothetical protein n=1 Tax=Fischerella sp. PCC 9605 TaxID=1173024 RepID=UPI0004B4D900|nr:hypothetical protein [Fischerella sp. PCC 9605]
MAIACCMGWDSPKQRHQLSTVARLRPDEHQQPCPAPLPIKGSSGLLGRAIAVVWFELDNDA